MSKKNSPNEKYRNPFVIDLATAASIVYGPVTDWLPYENPVISGAMFVAVLVYLRIR